MVARLRLVELAAHDGDGAVEDEPREAEKREPEGRRHQSKPMAPRQSFRRAAAGGVRIARGGGDPAVGGEEGQAGPCVLASACGHCFQSSGDGAGGNERAML